MPSGKGKANKVSFQCKAPAILCSDWFIEQNTSGYPPIFCRSIVHFTERHVQQRIADPSCRRIGMTGRLIFWLTLGGISVSFLGADFLDRLNVTRVKSAAYDELFADGVRAYSAEKWSEAVELLEKAIADYNHELEVKLHCRLHCRDRYRASSARNVISDLELDYYRYTIYSHKCAQKCKEKYLGKRTKVSAAVRSDFEIRVPYGYLQFAYYKVS